MIVLVPLDVDGEDGAPREFLQPEIHVGRGPHNDLVLDEDDRFASYEHALIKVRGEHAAVVCEPTANPTYIDGADISDAPEDERQLHPGDIVSFGKGSSIFRVRRVGNAEEAREPLQEEGERSGVYPIIVQVFTADRMVRKMTFNQPLIRVGRMKSSHLLLIDKSVSRTHAVIEVTPENEVLLLDLDSSSGTTVNGARIKKAILQSGDHVQFGDARVIVTWVEAAAGAASASPAQPARGKRNPPRSSPPPVPRGGTRAPNKTQVLSPNELEPLDSARLLVRRSGTEPDEFVLAKPHTTIGRLPENDIQLDDATVSGRHATLVAEKGVFLIIDQRSTNGTYVNGEKCAGEGLKDGDVIQIGRYELAFVAPRPAAVRSAPKTEVLDPEAARALFAKLRGRRRA